MQEVECGVCGKKVDREKSNDADRWMLIDITINPQPWVNELHRPHITRRARICSDKCALTLMKSATTGYKVDANT